MDHLIPFRRYFKWAALVCTASSGLLTFVFGLHQSDKLVVALALALFLVACSIASDYLNLFVLDAWRSGRKVFAGIVAAGFAFMFTLNLTSNLGSVGWQREVVIKDANFQQTKFDDTRNRLEQAQAERIALVKYRDKLTAEAPWAASVSADGLRAGLAAADKAIELEAKRGGCGPKCQGLMEKKADMEKRIGEAEKLRDYNGKIAQLDGLIAKLGGKTAGLPPKVAAPESQAGFFASLVSFDLAPSDTAKTWTDRGIASWLALGLCIAPIIFSLVGWRARNEDDGLPAPMEAMRARLASVPVIPQGVAAAPQPEPPSVGFIPTIANQSATASPQGDYLARLLAGSGASRAVLGTA